MEPRYIVRWFSICFEIFSSSLLLVVLVDPVACFRCTALVDPVVGASLNSQQLASNHTDYLQEEVTALRSIIHQIVAAHTIYFAEK